MTHITIVMSTYNPIQYVLYLLSLGLISGLLSYVLYSIFCDKKEDNENENTDENGADKRC